MAGHLVSLREWQSMQPFATDKISIQKIRLVLSAGYDIWGRPKTQPVEISASMSLKEPFVSAANTDSLDTSTVHYGNMSKLIIDRAENTTGSDGTLWKKPEDLLRAVSYATSVSAAEPSVISSIQVETFYPKASVFGQGVGLRIYHNPSLDCTSTTLSLNRVSVPTLVGLNSHERKMKQTVLITAEIDRVIPQVSEAYFEMEQILVKTAEESSYGTLESLAEELAVNIAKYFLLPKQAPILGGLPEPTGIRIAVEKPSAVPLAEAPCVEIYRSTDPQDPFSKRVIGPKKAATIPFPLEGRLDEFVRSMKQD